MNMDKFAIVYHCWLDYSEQVLTDDDEEDNDDEAKFYIDKDKACEHVSVILLLIITRSSYSNHSNFKVNKYLKAIGHTPI